jgi:hypothetical protein
MRRFTATEIIGFLGFVLLTGLWYLIHQKFGQTEGVRVWGIGLLLVSVIFTLRAEIPIHVNGRAVAILSGWRKACVLVPTYTIGGLTTVFPHAVACGVSMKGYVCT